ncbi:efflux RND transporter permease subunit [Sulfurovum sp. XTW-4]|uniref:Efflux RND transporter permease subunit n=1 Tax=Sulfurovum xiamenensis TaxID=3019066 RepID=A0ABT7QT54_9BACT|nr:efflux RND transporter permease subunit [Sulfurovum xiamenensis]MDM5264268.1 efflux RND transporter permease subunit [Sulfurovum xiamenensis]
MIRSFIRFAVDKPIINHILMAFMLVLSVFAYQNIAKEIFPPSTLDQISVQGGYVGTSADVLDKMVVTSIEDELKSLPEIDTLYTSIQNGSFSINADIKPGSDTQLVLSDVKDIISKTRRDLPADMDEPIARIVVHEYPLLLVAVSGNVEKKALIDAADALKSKLALIHDLSSIEIRGDTDEEVIITLDQKKLDAYGLDKSGVYQAISSISSIFPAGTLDGQGDHLYISTINGEKSAKALGETLLSVGGKSFRLKDVAEVYYGLGDPTQISHYNGKQNISLNINKSKEGNAIALSKEIRKILVEFNEKYEDVRFEAYTDTSIWIKNRLNLVSSNILFGLILVFMALFLSVNIRIAWVVGIGIPASFFITLIIMDMIGYSLNMLTLLGALIALGMLVDEAIVVAENIYRHMEMGKSPRDAAIEGAIEMFPAVLTATLTTVFAFLPLLIMSGKMGMFMQVLPVMISVLLISSLFEAFYFLPLHSKEFFAMGTFKKEKHDSSFWKSWVKWYQGFLEKLLEYKKWSLSLILIFIVLGTMGMAKITKFQLFPEFDAQQVYLNGKVNINNDLQDTEVYVTQIEEALLEILDEKEMDSVTSVIGFKFNKDQSFELGENLFQIFINLHEKAPENFFDKYINPIFSLEYDGSDMIRERLSQEIAKEIQERIVPKFKAQELHEEKLYEEFNVYVQQAGIVSNDIEIGFEHPDRNKMLTAMKKVEAKLESINGVEDIADNANEGERELKLRVNEYGQQLGFSEGYVISVLKGAFLKAEYAKMFNKEGLVRVKIEDVYKEDASAIRNFKLTTPDGQQVVRLANICDFTYQKSFVKIFKEDGEKVRSLYARVEKKIITPVEVMQQLKPLLDEIQKEGVKIIIKGEEKENAKLKKELGQALMIALFLIFITLVWMFNSLVLPLIILTTIPLSLFGALVGTKLMGINMTMPGMMGVIGLAGVVVNDGLIMLDFIKGSKNFTQIQEKAGMRLRPILLTSVTTVLGLSSLMFFASGQALILQPMAISLGFGIAWATVLNLYYVPLMYAVIYRVK